MLPLKTQELINEQIATLPDYMQEALVNVAWQSELQKIAAKYRFEPDITNRFIVETALVVIGAADPVQYGQKLITEIGLDETLVKKIAPEIEERVFAPLQKYVLDNNQAELLMLEDEIEVLRKISESDVNILDNQEDFVSVETEGVLENNFSGVNTKSMGTDKKIANDPYHEPVDPNDLIM